MYTDNTIYVAFVKQVVCVYNHKLLQNYNISTGYV